MVAAQVQVDMTNSFILKPKTQSKCLFFMIEQRRALRGPRGHRSNLKKKIYVRCGSIRKNKITMSSHHSIVKSSPPFESGAVRYFIHEILFPYIASVARQWPMELKNFRLFPKPPVCFKFLVDTRN